MQPINSRRSSVSIEEIHDDDDLPPNVAPKNKTHILELSDGSEDELEDDCPALIEIDNDDDDDDEKMMKMTEVMRPKNLRNLQRQN
jgi:hypothetical protein